MTPIQRTPLSPALQPGQYRTVGQAQITQCTHAFPFTVSHQPYKQLSCFSQMHPLAGLGRFSQSQPFFQKIEQFLRVMYRDAHLPSYRAIEFTSNVEQGDTGAKEVNELFFWKAPDRTFSNPSTVLENPCTTGAAHG